ncbi:xylulokinase [Thermoflexibacter ruber]|uniref:Xylulokinase n=1 Tax=Thermoflexibacter ruber TaxID=1003 RepID=A0A1I2HX10_9BACT|nr:FGGY family carbohydrate kinase [Thermoflexibacter ruber]SFF34559.1 xylulokinase [Thermoflexibacter ruber]
MYLLGYDIGSSSIKATLLEAETGKVKASATAPSSEMEMIALKAGWAEQHPDKWWEYVKQATQQLLHQSGVSKQDIKSIGISYQMHGLVVVNKDLQPLRPSIIWCDSRAVQIGEKAFGEIGEEQCLAHLLNSPANFTASKLKWVKENEPDLYAQAYRFMLPGDYIAMKMSGEVQTTASGLSEGILWDFKEKKIADFLLAYYGIDRFLVPTIVPSFGQQAQLGKKASEELGLEAGTWIAYRAGDQPNNAFSLNVLNAGEVAATAGTSGVVYGVSDSFQYDKLSRVNTFLHVNHKAGILLCINGTGILNSWLRRNVFSEQTSYQAINQLASQAPIGADGLCILPFGNGSERVLANKEIGGNILGLQFNLHTKAHLARAVQEGIVFALRYGFDVMKGIDVHAKTVKAGDANMFLSPLFAQTFANATNTVVELYNTDGSQGAARAGGVGAGIYPSFLEAFVGLHKTQTIEPQADLKEKYEEVYQNWLSKLNSLIA